MYKGTNDFFVDAVNQNSQLTLFKKNEQDGFDEIDLSFLQGYNVYIENKYVYADNHYMLFYYQYDEENDRDSSGVAIVKNGQVVHNVLLEESWTDSWELKSVDGVYAWMVTEEDYDELEGESTYTRTVMWYDGQSLQSKELTDNFDNVSRAFYLNDNIYYFAANYDNQTYEYDTKMYQLDVNTKIVTEFTQNVIDPTEYPQADYLVYYNGKVYFRTRVPTQMNLYQAIVEFDGTTLATVSQPYNSLGEFAISSAGILYLVDYSNSEFDTIDLTNNNSMGTVSFSLSNFGNLYSIGGEIYFTNSIYNGFNYDNKIYTLNTSGATELDSIGDRWLDQMLECDGEVLALIYENEGDANIYKLDEQEGLVEAFNFTKEDGFAKNEAYRAWSGRALGDMFCFKYERRVNENTRNDGFACYDGDKLNKVIVLPQIYGPVNNEYFNYDPFISNGRIIITTNFDRVIIVDEELNKVERQNMSNVGEPLLWTSNGELIFKNKQDSSLIEVLKSDGTIVPLVSTLFNVNNSYNTRRTGEFLLFIAEGTQSNQQEVFKMDKNGVITKLTQFTDLNWDNLNDNPYLLEKDDNKIYNLRTDEMYNLDFDGRIREAVIVGNTLWIRARALPYRDYYIYKGDLSSGGTITMVAIDEDVNFSTSDIYYGGRGISEDDDDFDNYSNVRLRADELVAHGNHIYFVGQNENGYRIIFRKHVTTGAVEEFFHPELNPRNYLADSLVVVGDKLYFKALSPDVNIGVIYGELQLNETKYNSVNFYTEEEMAPENFKAAGDFGQQT